MEEEKKKRSNREEVNMETHTRPWSDLPQEILELTMEEEKKERSNREEVNMETHTRPWSDLPREILELIKKRLFFAGQLAFPAVCKSWSSIDSFPPQKQIPWLIVFDLEKKNDTWLCKLVDPTSSKTYNIDMKAIKEKEKVKDFNTVRVLESKYGWLLISSDQYSHHQYPYSKTSLFLYSPFYEKKNNFIELPVLHHDSIWIAISAAFTSNPLEEDCLFLIVLALSNGTVIYTCRRGDKSWSCLDSYFPAGKSVSWSRWMYSEGIFYYTDDNGYDNYKIGTFDIALKKWSVIPPPPTSPQVTFLTARNHYIVKTDGEELFLVYAPFLRGDFIEYFYRLDLSSMIWERVNGLGDKVLFMGDGYKSVLKLSEMKMKGISPDMVYYCGGSNLGCLSAVDRIHMKDKSHEDDSFGYGSMATISCRKIFIDPPHHHHYHH